MDKYIESLEQIKLKNSPAYYAISLPSSIPIEELPFFYQVRQGDRLDTLSQLFYNTPNKWWVIAKANNLVNGSIAVQEGTQLFIPNV